MNRTYVNKGSYQRAYFYGNDYFYLSGPKPLWFIFKAHEKSTHVEMWILNTQHCNNQNYQNLILLFQFIWQM